jgi:hypothetical protein
MKMSVSSAMGRVLALVVSSVMVVGVLSAQGMRISPEERAKALKDSLGLDADQTSKVVTIYKESQKSIQDAFQNASGDRESMRGTMQEITKKADEKVKALLNDTQKKKFEEMIKNRPQRGMRPPRN